MTLIFKLGACERINCHEKRKLVSGFLSKTGAGASGAENCHIFTKKCLLLRGNVTFFFQMRVL